MNKKSIETWLPVFPGFYGTLFEPDYSDEVDEIKKYGIEISKYKTVFIDEDKIDDIVNDLFDNERYEQDVCLSVCKIIERECDLIEKVEFQKEISPKFYNYTNDSINCIIDVDMDKLKKWIAANKEYLNDYFIGYYSSYDGFMSNYPNSYEGWEEETEKFSELGGHYLGAILQARCEQDEFFTSALHEDCEIYPFSYVNMEDVFRVVREEVINHRIEHHDPNQLKVSF